MIITDATVDWAARHWTIQSLVSIYLSFYLSISIDLPIHLTIYPSINPSIHKSTNPSIHQSINLSIHQSINRSNYPSIHQSINPSIHQSINLSIDPTIYLSIYPSIYLSRLRRWGRTRYGSGERRTRLITKSERRIPSGYFFFVVVFIDVVILQALLSFLLGFDVVYTPYCCL